MVSPHIYPEFNESRWNWDNDTKTATYGLGVNVGFIVLKNSLYYLKGLSAKP